jgi:hypothetical protein
MCHVISFNSPRAVSLFIWSNYFPQNFPFKNYKLLFNFCVHYPCFTCICSSLYVGFVASSAEIFLNFRGLTIPCNGWPLLNSWISYGHAAFILYVCWGRNIINKLPKNVQLKHLQENGFQPLLWLLALLLSSSP